MKKFQKNKVYLFRSKKKNMKMVCVMVDKEYAALCPISGHKKDSGYSIKMSQVQLDANQYDEKHVTAMGYIKAPNLHYYKN